MPGIVAEKTRRSGMIPIESPAGFMRLVSADDWLRLFPDGSVSFYARGCNIRCWLSASHMGNEVRGYGEGVTSGDAFYRAILKS